MAGLAFNKKVVILFGVLLVLFGPVARADFLSAMANYDAKNFPAAMEELMRIAPLGHKDAQMNIGVMYFRGEGVTKDLVESFAWLDLSATDGDANKTRIRDAVLSKLDDEQKIRAVARKEELLKQYGDDVIKATYFPSPLKEDFISYVTPYVETIKIPPAGIASKEFSDVILMNIDQDGVVSDYMIRNSKDSKFNADLIEYITSLPFKPALRNGQVAMRYAHHFSFTMSQTREKFDHDEIKRQSKIGRKKYAQEAEENFIKVFSAAQEGDAESQLKAAEWLLYRGKNKTDIAKGLSWLEHLAKNNNGDAQYLLGCLYYSSSEVGKNESLALHYLERAATNSLQATFKLAWILATSKDDKITNANRALGLIEPVVDAYPDQITAYETLAAAKARSHDFDGALIAQKKAVEYAGDSKKRLLGARKKLDAYSNHQHWRE